MTHARRTFVFAVALGFLTAGLGLGTAHARHGNDAGAHWKQQEVRLLDSVAGAAWDLALADASATWNAGLTKVQTTVEASDSDPATRQACPYARRAVRVCNGDYGWGPNLLGVAQFSYSVRTGHIKKARIRMNEGALGYEEATTVHEVGHTLGLDHRPQSAAPGSCMTPSILPAQVSPDAHDYQVVDRIHRHKGHAGKHSYRTKSERRGDTMHVTWVEYR